MVFASSPKSTTESQVGDHPETLTLSVVSPDPFPWSPCLSETLTTSLCVESPWALIVLPTQEDSIANAPSAVSSANFNKKGIELPHESSTFSPLE